MHKKLHTFCAKRKINDLQKIFIKKVIDKRRPLWYNVIVLEREYTPKNFILKNGEMKNEKNRNQKRVRKSY